MDNNNNNHNHHHFLSGSSSNANARNNHGTNDTNTSASNAAIGPHHHHNNGHHNGHHNSNHSSSTTASNNKRPSFSSQPTAANNNSVPATDVVMTDLTTNSNSNATSVSPTATIPTWRNYDFKLQSWEAVAFWKWELEVDTCPICRNQIMDLCIECQGKFEGTAPTENEEADCSIAWGICNHAFHMHCISRWLKNRNVCPLDNQTWEYSRIGR